MAGLTSIKYSKAIKPTGGINKYLDAIELPDDQFQDCSNIHISNGKLMKRPAKLIWYATAYSQPFYGVTEYIDKTGTSRVLLVSGNKLYENDGTTSTERDTVAAENTHFHTLRGKCFYNSATVQRRIDGTTPAAVGLAAPDSAPTTAAGIAGALTGSYAVKVTFVIEESGARVYESDPSTVSNSTTLSSQKLNLTGVPVSADARVTHRYIYRTTAGGAKYWYDGKIADNTTTTYTTEVTDASLGAEVEVNHGQPNQASISCGCNERQFWADGSVLRHSESAQTDTYVEYQKSTSFKQRRGTIKGLAPLYNENIGREDLYIFHDDHIAILPAGDPNNPIVIARNNVGAVAHDTICEHGGWLYFMTNQDSIGMIKGNTYMDISTLRIKSEIEKLLTKEECHAAIIFDHYYAFTCRNDAGKLYNHLVWVCDLETIKEAKAGQADAVWYPWELDAQYLIQLSTGTVLMLDTHGEMIYKLETTSKRDQDATGAYVDFTAWFRTKNFTMGNIIAFKKAMMLAIKGANVKVIPYAWDTITQEEMIFQPVVYAFIPGQSKMGQPLTKVNKFLEQAIGSGVVGNMFSFKFYNDSDNFLFELIEFMFTYQVCTRGLV